MCAGAGTSVSSKFSVNSSNHAGRFRNRFPARFLVPDRHFALLPDFLDVLDESSGSDVEDELVP